MSSEFSLPDQLLSSKQLRLLAGGISDMTLWRWQHAGKIPSPIMIGSRRFWRWSQIKEWLDAHSQMAGAA